MDFLGLFENLHILDDAPRQHQTEIEVSILFSKTLTSTTPAFTRIVFVDWAKRWDLPTHSPACMRQLLKQMRPDHFEEHFCCSRPVSPGSDLGAKSHTNYAMPKQGQQAYHAHPPRTSRNHSRTSWYPPYGSDRLSRAGHGDRSARGGVFARTGRQIYVAQWEKKSRKTLDKEFPSVLGWNMRARVHQTRDQDPWYILVPFSDYAFNKSHSAAYGVIAPTSPPTSKRTTRLNSSPHFYIRRRRPRQAGRLSRRGASHGGHSSTPRHQRVGSVFHRGR